MLNNFKELEKMEIAQAKYKDQYVKSNINSSVNTFKFVGNMVEHFVPRVVDLFIHMTGGDFIKLKSRKSKYPNTPL